LARWGTDTARTASVSQTTDLPRARFVAKLAPSSKPNDTLITALPWAILLPAWHYRGGRGSIPGKQVRRTTVPPSTKCLVSAIASMRFSYAKLEEGVVNGPKPGSEVLRFHLPSGVSGMATPRVRLRGKPVRWFSDEGGPNWGSLVGPAHLASSSSSVSFHRMLCQRISLRHANRMTASRIANSRHLTTAAIRTYWYLYEAFGLKAVGGREHVACVVRRTVFFGMMIVGRCVSSAHTWRPLRLGLGTDLRRRASCQHV